MDAADKNFSAELLPILLNVCPSYRQHHASSSLERRLPAGQIDQVNAGAGWKPALQVFSSGAIADVKKYSDLCKDFGGHLADMFAARDALDSGGAAVVLERA